MKSAKKQQDQRTEGDHWGDDDVPTVSEVIGEGAAAHRIVRVGAWEFVAPTADSEPRMRDLDLAARLGNSRPRDIRPLIARWEPEIGPILSRETVSRGLCRGKTATEVTVIEYWLTEAQALFIAAKSETKGATAILKDMIRVYMLARRGLYPQQYTTADPRTLVQIEALTAIVVRLKDDLGDVQQRLATGTGYASGCVAPLMSTTIKRRLWSMGKTLGVAKIKGRGPNSWRQTQDRKLRATLGHMGPWNKLSVGLESKALLELDAMERAADMVVEVVRETEARQVGAESDGQMPLPLGEAKTNVVRFPGKRGTA